MFCLFMSENQIRDNWETLRQDPDNPRPDIHDPEEWIARAKAGELVVLGARVAIHNGAARLPGDWRTV